MSNHAQIPLLLCRNILLGQPIGKFFLYTYHGPSVQKNIGRKEVKEGLYRGKKGGKDVIKGRKKGMKESIEGRQKWLRITEQIDK